MTWLRAISELREGYPSARSDKARKALCLLPLLAGTPWAKRRKQAAASLPYPRQGLPHTYPCPLTP